MADWQPVEILYDIESAPPNIAVSLSPIERLTIARNAIASGFTTRTWALDYKDNGCDPWADTACKWCTVGAIQATIYYEPTMRVEKEMFLRSTLVAANPSLYVMSRRNNKPNGSILESINDHELTHEQVVQAFDRAIAFLIKRNQTDWPPMKPTFQNQRYVSVGAYDKN